VLDAIILLKVQPANAMGIADQSDELLYPARHEMTLPLNGLNMLFSDYTVAINHHTKIDSDRYVHLLVISKMYFI
jgi:hypothetical protein